MTIILTPYQAKIIIAALQVFRQEQEAALQYNFVITPSKMDTHNMLTCLNSTEEADLLQNLIAEKFDIKEK